MQWETIKLFDNRKAEYILYRKRKTLSSMVFIDANGPG